MLSEDQAVKAIGLAFPDCTIAKHISYNEVYVFQVVSKDPDEGDFDPFYSVNPKTGEIRGFSLFAPGNNAKAIMDLFEKA